MTTDHTEDFENVTAVDLEGHRMSALESVAHRIQSGSFAARASSLGPVYPSDEEMYDDDRLNSIPRYDEQFGY